MELQSAVRIVLVEPNGALNVGSVARVMKNFGLQQLILVRPRCSPQAEDAQKMATHARDVLEACQVVDDLATALRGCVRVIATTAQTRNRGTRLELPEEPLSWLLSTHQPVALLFGAEDRGLSNDELSWAQRWVQIPGADYNTLNLAQSVAICCYEVFRAQQALPRSQPDLAPAVSEPDLPALQHWLERWADHLQRIGFLYAHTRAERLAKLRELFYRAQPNNNELAMLHGIISQTEWALQHLPRHSQPAHGAKKGQDPDH
jgi:tRNA/rRNA methyltransferase